MAGCGCDGKGAVWERCHEWRDKMKEKMGVDFTGEEPTRVPQVNLSEQKSRAHGWWRPLLLLAAILGIIVLSKIFGLDQRLGDLREWIQSLGAWGPVVFVILYVAAVVAALPGAAISIAAGALFGALLGVVLVSIASTLGASLAFLISRYFARGGVVRWLSSNEKFQRLDQLTERHGAIIVALTRLVPIFPFNLLNYGFGLTRVPFRTYVFWSWLCMLPGTVLYVGGADAVIKGIAKGHVPWVLISVVAGAAVILFFLVRYARGKLKEKEKPFCFK
jgi:uncharacterized membrane protein YdjX (TVP38/TMEM64 family)